MHALASLVAGIIRFCTRFAWPVIVLGLCVSGASAIYSARHFAIDTEINKLISPELDWRQRELNFEQQFPTHFRITLIVLDAPTPELASIASRELVKRVSAQTDLFHSAEDFADSDFFARNGLLFRPTNEIEPMIKGLTAAAPLVGALADDPSLRGLTQALSLGLTGVQRQMVHLDALARPMTMASDAIDAALADRPASFSWMEMLGGRSEASANRRHFIEVRPILDFTALEPGRASSEAIRRAADDLQLSAKYQARIRLTGSVPMADDEFATVRHGALRNGIGTIVIVIAILWMALKSVRIIAAVFLNLFVGLSITAALGLIMVGALNLISVAFAILFVGLGVDFAIQYSVRYRAERNRGEKLEPALALAGARVGMPLTLAAASVAAGFLSFLPTSYRGVSELGQIAGVGMLIAYATSITFLPALLSVLKPPEEPKPVGYRALAPIDRFLLRRRIPVIITTIAVAVLASPLLFYLTFDFDPIHLRNPKTESVATLLDLGSDPRVGINSINLVAQSLQEAEAAANRLRQLPGVSRTMTLASFVPDDQPRKLALIRELEQKVGPDLSPADGAKPPSDDENIAALTSLAEQLNKIADASQNGPGAAAARRLAADCVRLIKADRSHRNQVQATFVAPLQFDLLALKSFTQASEINIEALPADIKAQWLTPDGMARVEMSPEGDIDSTEVLRNFARSVLAVYPNAVGGPVSILMSGDTVVRAFTNAGLLALLAIALILWLVLRRFGDVLLTLVPLLLAGVVTLELSVLIGMPLNFANIIALPLMLGVGVAFKIYYIVAWRRKQTNLLQSSLTRAVIWSALATATAFGSLWLSSHPGTSSMGKLLALSLICTLAAAGLFQPALMGAPRGVDEA
jgi:hopanoid biosynthesis associated RND transporter like protein HpnN